MFYLNGFEFWPRFNWDAKRNVYRPVRLNENLDSRSTSNVALRREPLFGRSNTVCDWVMSVCDAIGQHVTSSVTWHTAAASVAYSVTSLLINVHVSRVSYSLLLFQPTLYTVFYIYYYYCSNCKIQTYVLIYQLINYRSGEREEFIVEILRECATFGSLRAEVSVYIRPWSHSAAEPLTIRPKTTDTPETIVRFV